MNETAHTTARLQAAGIQTSFVSLCLIPPSSPATCPPGRLQARGPDNASKKSRFVVKYCGFERNSHE